LYQTRHLEEMMMTSFKYGVSAIALLAAISLAQAQTSERQGGGASGSEHSMGGRGGESGKSAQGERGGQGGAASHAERGQNGGSSHHQGRSAEQGDHSGQQKGQGNSATEHEQGGAQEGRTAEERGEGGAEHQGRSAEERTQGRSANQIEQQHGQSAERNRNQEHGQEQERNRAENRADRERERTGQAERSEQGKSERSARTDRENRGMQGDETRGRETELGGARGNEDVGRARGESNRFASISREQKTRIHGILVRDTAIHRYHRADVDFPVQVGTRIPNTIEFYDPPAQVVQIDPVFRDYKIVVLDDVILVIDPATREIIDVIRA
jgi:hypothetical protein